MGTRRVVAERHLSDEELRDAIKVADYTRVVRRLCFVSNLYEGDTLKQATRRVGASRGIGSEWLTRWNEDGLAGLVPRFGGGRPPKFGVSFPSPPSFQRHAQLLPVPFDLPTSSAAPANVAPL